MGCTKRVKKAGRMLSCALRLVCVFTLAFSTTLGAQAAFASGQQPGQPGASVSVQSDKSKDDDKLKEDDKAADDAKDKEKEKDEDKEKGADDEKGGKDEKPTSSSTDDEEKSTSTSTSTSTSAGGNDKEKPPESASSASSSQDRQKPFVNDLALYIHVGKIGDPDDDDEPDGENEPTAIEELAFATGGLPDEHLAITERGGEIDFDAVAYWDDNSKDYGWSNVKFKLDKAGAELATIDEKTGVLKAKGGENGTVVVTAVLDKGYSKDDEPLEASIAVDLKGQESTPYVTAIQICDDVGKPIDPSYTFPEGETMKTATIALQAKVTVHDPGVVEKHAKGGDAGDTTYVVSVGNGLSKQTKGAVADISWSVIYDDRGSVSDEGEYRAIVEGDNTVRAVSQAGADGAQVVDEAMIVLEGEGHAQDTLTVDAVWESNPGEVVKTKQFSASDVRKIGTKVQSYTVYGTFGNSSFVTYTGRGILLSELLKAAGIDDSGVAALRVDCWDVKGYEISWDLLVGKNRYYFPNMDIGSQADAVQVAPMLAVESARAPEGSSDAVPEDKLANDDCFRLLFGVGMDDEGQNTRQMQRRWVNAIHVTLAGAPPEENPERPGDPAKPDDPKNPDDPKKPAGPDNPNDPGSPSGPDGPGDPGDPSNPDDPDDPENPDNSDNPDDPSNPADSTRTERAQGTEPGQATASEASSAEGTAGEQAFGAAAGKGGSARHNQGAWSILQAVNRNDSDVDALDFDNPFRPYTAPTCAGLFAAGGVEAFVRFRWQKRTPDMSEVQDES